MLAGGTMEPVGEVEQQLLNKSTKGVMITSPRDQSFGLSTSLSETTILDTEI